jgi:hypothetical protein
MADYRSGLVKKGKSKSVPSAKVPEYSGQGNTIDNLLLDNTEPLSTMNINMEEVDLQRGPDPMKFLSGCYFDETNVELVKVE